MPNIHSPNKKKIRLLFYGDSPTANTGFGCVSRNLLKQLNKTGQFDITVLGIQYFDDPEIDLYIKESLPYRIISAGNNKDNDMFGRRKLLQLIAHEPFDLILTLQDLPNLDFQRLGFNQTIRNAIDFSKKQHKVNTKWIIYTPIDGQLKDFELNPIKQADFVVVYTRYGYGEVMRVAQKEVATKTNDQKLQQFLLNELKRKITYIYHGIDTETFYPVPRKQLLDFRKQYFNIEPNDFLIININRNQHRKSLFRTIEAYSYARSKINELRLYLHCKNEDIGGNLSKVLEAFSSPPNVIMPANFDFIKGISEEVLNKIYNCADLYVTTTLGEGWGLTVTEAMACKVPTLIPAHSSLIEIGENNRTFFVDPVAKVVIPEDFYRLRPIVNTCDLAQKVEYIFHNKKSIHVKHIVNNAYKWITKLTWDKIAQEWVQLFERVLNETIKK